MQFKYDSDEEMFFHHWLLELEEKGFIADIHRASAIQLASPIVSTNGVLLAEGIEYTPDFRFRVLKDGQFFQSITNPSVSCSSRKDYRLTYNEDQICIVEVKPTFDMNNMTREVQIKRKWVYQLTNTFVELVKVPGSSNKGSHLFSKTFTPQSYLFTKTKKTRKMNYKVRLIGEVLK